MKKALSFCLGVFFALALTFVFLPTTLETPVSAATSGYYTYTVSNGKAIITEVDNAISGDITIPSKLGGYSVTEIGNGAFWMCDNLISVTIPPSVTAIGNSAFFRCDLLANVNLGNGVTTIADGAFAYCVALVSVTGSDSLVSIGDSAFCYCTNLTTFTFSDKLTTIDDYAFPGCFSMTSLNIPASVTYIGESAFNEWRSLSSIAVAEGNTVYHSEGDCLIETASKTLIAGCKNSIIPSDGSVNKIGSAAFFGHLDLTSVIIPNSVTSIGGSAFSYCSSLTSINIPNSVTSIGGSAFYDCTELTSVTIGNSVTTIGEESFEGCYGLTDVWYEGTATDRQKITIGSYNDSLTDATWHYVDNACDATCNDCGVERTVEHYTKMTVHSTSHTLKNDATYPFTKSGDWTVSTNKTKSTASTYTITAQHACTLSLNYKVSSEKNYDKMTVKKNSTTLDTISGEVEKSTTITLAKGDTITISYAKDGRTDGGDDCAYFKFSCSCDEEREVPSSTLSPTCTEDVVCSRCGVTVKSAVGHKYDNTCDSSCNVCSEKRSVTHTYSNACDTTCNICGETRTVPHVYDNAEDLICNECGHERPPYTPGDLDGVPGVTIDDAIYLLFYVNFQDSYPVNQPVDFDGDSDVDMDDAIYLLFHVNFQDQYPLH